MVTVVVDLLRRLDLEVRPSLDDSCRRAVFEELHLDLVAELERRVAAALVLEPAGGF